MRIVYQSPTDRRTLATSEHTKALCEWLRAEGINPDDVPSDRFVVIEDDGGALHALFVEFERDEDGVKTLIQGAEPTGYHKTPWRTRPVSTAPPEFVGLDVVAVLA